MLVPTLFWHTVTSSNVEPEADRIHSGRIPAPPEIELLIQGTTNTDSRNSNTSNERF